MSSLFVYFPIFWSFDNFVWDAISAKIIPQNTHEFRFHPTLKIYLLSHHGFIEFTNESVLELEPDEYITRVTGTYDDSVAGDLSGIEIVTNKSPVPWSQQGSRLP